MHINVLRRCHAATSIQSLKSERPDWYEQRRVNFLMRFSREAKGEEATLPWYVDLLPETERSAAEYLLGQARFARAFASPPEIPPARLAALREAFAAAVGGAEFLAEMETTGLEHTPMHGDEMARLIAAKRAADPALKQRAKQLVSDP